MSHPQEEAWVGSALQSEGEGCRYSTRAIAPHAILGRLLNIFEVQLLISKMWVKTNAVSVTMI